MQSSSKSSKQSPSLKARALRLLSRREYSRKELASKLLQLVRRDEEDLAVDIEEQIETVLNDFEARAWLSDERFAQALVRRRSGRYGVRRVADELERSGIETGLISQLTGELKESEYDRAKALWTRKFGQIPTEQKERARQYRFLISKGFSPELVAKVIGGREPSV
ncbi:recombination regulator RecX [Burkholderiaceae bacterium]